MKAAIKLLITLITLMALATPRYVHAEDTLHRDFRVRPEGRFLLLVCSAKNIVEEDVFVNDLLWGHNGFRIKHLHDSSRNRFGRFGMSISPPDYPGLRILPSKKHYWVRDIEDIVWSSGMSELDYPEGRYNLITWRIRHESAQTICLGVTGADGNIRPPVVNPKNPNVEMYLGFVYRPWNKLEVCFLFLNGTDEDITLAQPLDQTSHIHVSMPAIDYSRDLFVPDQESEQVTIEAGKVGEWRLPWQTVIDLIPTNELEQIKAAGGDIDMVWRVGEHQSMPLPISLVAADNEDVQRWVRPVRVAMSQKLYTRNMSELFRLTELLSRIYESGRISKEEIEQMILWTEEHLEAENDRLMPETRVVVEGFLKELKEVKKAIEVDVEDKD